MMLEIKDVYFKYTDEYVLQDISFTLGKGKILGILGENGVGKSTLFKCILGFLKPTSGSILVDGIDIDKLSLRERAKKIAYIHQSHFPTFNHDVVNVVEMGANVRLSDFGVPKKEEREKAFEKLEILGIENLANRGYKEISGGERQLVLIARALMQDAKILIMDEPTANLDYGNQMKVLKTCKELSNMGYSIIQSTHHPQHAFMFFDEALLMHEHKILAIGKSNEVLTEKNLKKIYDIDLKIIQVENEGVNHKVLIPKFMENGFI